MDESKAQAFENEWRTGDRAVAKEMAKDLVDRYPDAFRRYEGLSIPELVDFVEVHRNHGREYQRRLTDIYLLARHEPQQIGGTANIGRIN